MKKYSVYDLFIGLLALMVSLMLVIEILTSIPIKVTITFYYIENIVKVLFLGDLLYYFIFNRNYNRSIIVLFIDGLSVVPVTIYMELFRIILMKFSLHGSTIYQIIRVILIFIYIAKFKIRVRDKIKENRVYLLFIISTMIIVIGAILISLLEGISLSDALWWSFVTFTTVGYGDILLKTQLGRAVAVILMFIGIGVIGVTTTALALYILEGNSKKSNNRIIDEIKDMVDNYKNLTDEDIDQIGRVLKSLKEKE